ncbi:MAG: hypothetical protein BA861_00345 [Desulfobacterales bacterium S3730MH5]|nr:MAG: hypothetical protein BA861_00345 [Desulfobacterales bacterium S3730MH5]OEU84834.1 MAG: hypothetical protein BA865_00545 [Desulfobacterales bacterium S5133MH4]
MSKKNDETRSPLKPEIARELDKIKVSKQEAEKLKRENRPLEEKLLEQEQRTKIKDAQHKILKDEGYNKHRKADKKIGGVRGKFRPSLDRTRKRT